LLHVGAQKSAQTFLSEVSMCAKISRVCTSETADARCYCHYTIEHGGKVR